MANEVEKLPVSAVAEAMKTTPLNVMMHIKRGLLAGVEIDGSWFVPADSLANYLADPARASNGSICKSSCKHNCASCS